MAGSIRRIHSAEPRLIAMPAPQFMHWPVRTAQAAIILICGVFFLTGLSAEVKTIALTFDDAPRGEGPFFSGTERTQELIAALESAGAQGAMFYVTTGLIEKYDPEHARLKAYVDAGHVLANHSHSHPWLHRSDAGQYLQDIDKASNILTDLEGYHAFYRFPYLDEGRSQAKRDAVRQGLVDRGLKHGYVTVDNYDWYMQALVSEAVKAGFKPDQQRLGETYVDLLLQSIEFYDEIAEEHLGRSPAHVLLLHENDLAALYIDDLVQALRERGWTIVPALEAYRDPLSALLPETLFNGQGRVAALAHAQGVPAQQLVHHSEDEQWLRQEFLRRGLLPRANEAEHQ